jgi:DNA-binding transcriptional regulator YdaS (Cro superfamily)
MSAERPPAIVLEAAMRIGGLSELARKLGIRHTAFYRWAEVPAKRVLKIEKITGISRHDLRPDLYPRER